MGALPALVGGDEDFVLRIAFPEPAGGLSSSQLFKLARNSSAWKRAASN